MVFAAYLVLFAIAPQRVFCDVEYIGSVYGKVGWHSYPSSPYFERTESLGILRRDNMASVSEELGFLVMMTRSLSIGFSALYMSKEIPVSDVDYSGKFMMTNTIYSFPVRYHIAYRELLFSFGGSLEEFNFRKSYTLSTQVNKDNSGTPTYSGSSTGSAYGLGALLSLDLLLGRTVSLFLEDWYHFAPSVNGQNAYGDSLNPGGNTFSFGVRIWI